MNWKLLAGVGAVVAGAVGAKVARSQQQAKAPAPDKPQSAPSVVPSTSY